jgi:hypothetical protein
MYNGYFVFVILHHIVKFSSQSEHHLMGDQLEIVCFILPLECD